MIKELHLIEGINRKPYLERLIKKGLKRLDDGENIIFTNGYRTLTISKKSIEFEFKEIKEKLTGFEVNI